MTESEKSIYGRKIFFINPNLSFETNIIERLRLMEYEVYVIDDYRKAKPLLRKNPDSICFCIIENQLTLKGWHNFIKSFENEEVFASLDMGLLIHSIEEDKKTDFLKGLQYDAGLIKLHQDDETLFHEIVKAVDAKNAKGMRKYVRASCINESQADLLWLKDNKMFKLKIIDISSAGIAAKLSNSQANAVFVNQIIEGVTLNLKDVQASVDIKISAMKSAGDFLLVVIMFTNTTPVNSINKIRGYIAETLQESLRTMLRSTSLDKTDYEKLELPH